MGAPGARRTVRIASTKYDRSRHYEFDAQLLAHEGPMLRLLVMEGTPYTGYRGEGRHPDDVHGAVLDRPRLQPLPQPPTGGPSPHHELRQRRASRGAQWRRPPLGRPGPRCDRGRRRRRHPRRRGRVRRPPTALRLPAGRSVARDHGPRRADATGRGGRVPVRPRGAHRGRAGRRGRVTGLVGPARLARSRPSPGSRNFFGLPMKRLRQPRSSKTYQAPSWFHFIPFSSSKDFPHTMQVCSAMSRSPSQSGGSSARGDDTTFAARL